MVSYKLQHGRIRVRDFIVMGALSLLFVYNTLTFLNNEYSFYLSVIASGLFAFFTYFSGFKWRRNDRLLLCTGVALAASLILFINGAGSKWTTYVSGIVHIFIWASFSVFLIDNFDKKRIRSFVFWNAIPVIVCIIATLRTLSMYPLAARALYGKADGIADASFLFDLGCGGFGFVYGLVFVSFALLSCVRSKEVNKSFKLFCLCLLILSYYTILHAEFTTGLILVLLSILLELFYSEKHKIWPLVVFTVLAVTISLFYRNILLLVKDFAIDVNVSILAEKVDKILFAINAKDANSLMRFRMYMESINGFWEHPIFGSGTAGSHSQILDSLSYIGLFGFSYIGLLICAIKRIGSVITNKGIVILAILVFTSATLNPFVDMTLHAFVFFFTVLILYISSDKEVKL